MPVTQPEKGVACRSTKFNKTMGRLNTLGAPETKVPMVKLLGCSAGLKIPKRCPNSDVGTFEKPHRCSVSLPIPVNLPNSDVGPF